MLRDVTAIALESYLQWLNTIDPSHLAVILMVEAFKLHILGGFQDDSAFRIAMFKCFSREAIDNNQYPGDARVTHVWEQTPESSTLRRMVVNI